jgi:hypothetical protein
MRDADDQPTDSRPLRELIIARNDPGGKYVDRHEQESTHASLPPSAHVVDPIP